MTEPRQVETRIGVVTVQSMTTMPRFGWSVWREYACLGVIYPDEVDTTYLAISVGHACLACPDLDDAVRWVAEQQKGQMDG